MTQRDATFRCKSCVLKRRLVNHLRYSTSYIRANFQCENHSISFAIVSCPPATPRLLEIDPRVVAIPALALRVCFARQHVVSSGSAQPQASTILTKYASKHILNAQVSIRSPCCKFLQRQARPLGKGHILIHVPVLQAKNGSIVQNAMQSKKHTH
jgi:hypothetical protein